MTIHELKTHTKQFNQVASGNKTFEVRKDDRKFKVGDILHLINYDPVFKKYLPGEVLAEVIHILRGGQFGIKKGYIVMSLGPKIVSVNYKI